MKYCVSEDSSVVTCAAVWFLMLIVGEAVLEGAGSIWEFSTSCLIVL